MKSDILGIWWRHIIRNLTNKNRDCSRLVFLNMAVCLFYCSKLSRRGGGVRRHRRRIYIYIYAVSRRGVRRHVRRIFSQLGLPIPGLPPFLIVLLKGALKTLCFKLSFYTAIREWSRSNFHYCFIEGRPQNLTF